MDDPFRYFRVEARELADDLIAGIRSLERGSATTPAVAALLRSAHTLKGAARVVKQIEIADVAHSLEDVLGPFRDTDVTLPAGTVTSMLTAVDRISDLVSALAPPPITPSPSIPTTATRVATAPAGAQADSPGDTGLRTVRADLVEMDGLVEGVREAHAQLSRLHDCAEATERARSLADLVAQQLAPRGRDRSATYPEAMLTTGRSIALELRGMLTDLERRLTDATAQVDRELRQVRDAAERLRLVPASVLFTDLDRAVRDVARELGKQVRFETAGGDIRLDAHVVATTQAALHQIVRNAVAHGIETESERRRAGKPTVGLIELDVQRRGKRVVFTCRDDGRGVDLAAVRAVAEHRGLVSAARGNDSPEELMNILLAGGISTFGSVTEVAGRGVGLDVVRESAQRLGAHVRVSTDAGRGTTVAFEAPLSLVAFDALIVESARSTVAIPVDAVQRAIRVAAADVAITSDGEALVHDGQPIPLFSLASVLGVDTANEVDDRDRSRSVVIVSGSARAAAIGVDRLLGTSNIVIRPLPEGMVPDEVVAGVWFDADGNPRLVLDPDGLVDAAQHAQRRSRRGVRPAPILVIDDSVTTRMLEQSILEAAGYDVELAASAEEGLEKARSTRYSLFLVDIEMPGMDGFTFVERTRSDPDLHVVPAILVSSRATPEDRQRGLRAGASAYIAKGEFDQGVLLATIGTLVGG